MAMDIAAAKPAPAPGSIGFILKKALLSALVAIGLFWLMIGVRTETGVEILDGVAEGEAVVTQRAKPLMDGDRVRISGEGP